MRDDDNAVGELGECTREGVDVGLDSADLGEEVVADEGDVERSGLICHDEERGVRRRRVLKAVGVQGEAWWGSKKWSSSLSSRAARRW